MTEKDMKSEKSEKPEKTPRAKKSADILLQELEDVSKSSEIVHLEQRRFFVETERYEVASETVMKLVREGTWAVNLQQSGAFFAGKKPPITEFVLERRV